MPGVLVADDDRFAAEALRIHLTRAGIETAVAASGREALAQFAACQPRVVLLDAAMPDISGPEVCQQIRSTEAGAETVVIMVSGASTPSRAYVRNCAATSGVNTFVSKPYDMRKLIGLVQQKLERREEPAA